MPSPISAAVQDYVKSIYQLEGEQASASVSTKAIADRMVVSAASATNMLKRLATLGLVNHVPYKGAELTDAGHKVALEMLRHHRLLETYLAEALGVPWDKVHAEAEILEHVLSEDLEERISELLGHPTQDPHGHPIPTKDLSLPPMSTRALWDVDDGGRVAIEAVPDAQSEALRFLDELGIRPGTSVEVIRRGPGSGPLFLRVDGGSGDLQAISKELAEAVWVA